MTIAGWFVFAMLASLIGIGVFGLYIEIDPRKKSAKVAFIVAGICAVLALYGGMMWYFQNTASVQRAMIDQQSNFGNGMERTITVYTADGKIIAQYTGKIDIEGNDGGYVLFDYEGKRYTYYNCFVESVAEIEG